MLYSDLNGVTVPRLGMGAMRLPVSTKYVGHIDEKRACALVDRAMEAGVNYFDTAYIYHKGASESFLGSALARYPRDSYLLATKFFIGANPNYRAVFENQLEKLRCKRIDFYLIHSVFDLTQKAYDVSGSIAYFQEQKRLGRIGQLGFSAHMSPRALARFAARHDWDFVQLQINYEDWFDKTAEKLYRIAHEQGLPIIVMEPVKGGRLAALGATGNAALRAKEPNASIASWAMRFLMRLPDVKIVLSGMGTLEQLEDNIATFSEERPLSESDLALLERAWRLSRVKGAVPCTACRYCCDSCPRDLDIPHLLNLYNLMRAEGKRAAAAAAATAGIPPESGPAACISCGRCTKHCPQSIAIPEALGKLARALR